ncbi:MAG TPA: glycosyltransferase family 4 protein [Pirellulales bacterium]
MELANGLRDAGYHVEMAVTSWTNGEFPRRLKGLNHPYTQMRLGYISGTPRFNEMRMTAHQLVYVPALWSTYGRFIHRTAPRKIIHTNWHHLLLLLPFLRRNRDLFWLHEVIPNKSRYRKLFSIFARRLSCFVAVSHAVRESLTALGISPDLITVIHNGLSEFPVSPQSGDQLNVRIGIVGQVGPWKGHEDLLVAFARLVPECPNCELHIFGADSGGYVEYLRNLISAWKLLDRVSWHGFISDPSEIYSKIDICVVPSRFKEPFGLVAVEAAIAGVPCVATNQGGLPEIIQDGVTGLLVEPDNPLRLSEALKQLVKNPVLRSKLGAAAKLRAKDHFSRNQFVAEFAALLEKC